MPDSTPFGPGPFLIAGPCVLEDDRLNLTVAAALAVMAQRLRIPVTFKASFDKANRSIADAARGPGLTQGLEQLEKVKRESGLLVLTDVHESGQPAEAADVADVLQIPAFLCRQTDLLIAAGKTGKPVNVKKGQWMTPEAMAGALGKVRGAGSRQVAVTERGSFFGYGDLVVDMRGFERMRAACQAPVIFDATHSVQQPGRGAGGTSGGQREFIAPLLLAAAAAGADGFFLETHPDPANAPSDGPNMIPLGELEALVVRALDVWHAARGKGS